MSRGPFTPTHRLRVRFARGEGHVYVLLVAGQHALGPAFSRDAWEAEREADFRRTLSRWIYVGDEPGVTVVSARRAVFAPEGPSRG